VSTERPDCKTAHEAIAAMMQAIVAVPAEATTITWGFGKRNESVGGGWYWHVTYSLWAGTGHLPTRPDRDRTLADAVKAALERYDEVQAS